MAAEKNFFKKSPYMGFIGFRVFGDFFPVKLGYYKKTQLDRFMDFHGFSVIRMSTAR